MFAKKLKILYISCHTILFKFHQHVVQILINNACLERHQTSNVSVSNCNIKYPIGKSIFAINLPLKLFCATNANADTGSLNSLCTLFDTYLDHMLTIFEPNLMIQNVQNSVLIKNMFFLPVLAKRWRHFGRPFCSWKNC